MANQPLFATTNDRGVKKDSRVFIEWRALTCPKAEYTSETTEDRWAANPTLGLFAVADGVGSSYRAADWAQALVDAWTQEPFRNKTEFEVEWWVRKLQPRFVLTQEQISQLQPYAQDQARRGAGSTLLGLRLWPASDKKSALYQLLCIGDSDLIHYPHTIFPISNPKDFGSYPTVLRSKSFDRRQDRVERYPDRPREAAPDPKKPRPPLPLARLRPGDTLLLCTDAIAKWAIEADNRAGRMRGQPGAESVPSARVQLEAQTPESWPAFVEDLRRTVEIVDDDTTALFIRISADQHAHATNAVDGAGWQRVELTWPAINEAEKRWTESRRSEMAAALRQDPPSKIEVARIYGDGKYFAENYADTQTVTKLASEGRKRASELEQVNDAIRALNWDNPTLDQMAALAALQQRYGAGLSAEPQARGALRTMRDLLARPQPQPPRPSPPSIPPAPSAPPLAEATGVSRPDAGPMAPEAPTTFATPGSSEAGDGAGPDAADPARGESERGA